MGVEHSGRLFHLNIRWLMRKCAGEWNGTGALLKEQNHNSAERVIDSKLIASFVIDWMTMKKRNEILFFTYVIVSTLSVVVCILCFEFDRVQFVKRNQNIYSPLFWLNDRIYMLASIISAVGLITLTFTIFVGTRLAALEERCLLNKRDGLPGTLERKPHKFPRFLQLLMQPFGCMLEHDQDETNCQNPKNSSVWCDSQDSRNSRKVSIAYAAQRKNKEDIRRTLYLNPERQNVEEHLGNIFY